ncbi:MAG: sigma-70 family RNA polymerase sigma factor [Pirellulaceae bacterium]|nr:sigma-70 family RNA polymerase sigma factor [Pirellulaceae bacterium]MDP7017561.1 sigma-70 family RNA polymerase sigma factor [Pirellulaceae bacterium]
MTDWEGIVRTYGPLAFETGWRLLGNVADTEECVQDALFDAFRIYQRESVGNWGGLIRRLTSRRAIDRIRSRRPAETLDDDQLWASASDQPEQLAIERELAQRLRAALGSIPDQQANVFALHFFGEMSRTEIADAMDINENAVGVALHKARGKLRELLNEGRLSPTKPPRPAVERAEKSDE